MKRDVPSDAELFRAARLERAPESLRAALLGGDAASSARGSLRASGERKRELKRDGRPSWAAPAACAAAAALAALCWGSMPGDVGVPISAEQPMAKPTASVVSHELPTAVPADFPTASEEASSSGAVAAARHASATAVSPPAVSPSAVSPPAVSRPRKARTATVRDAPPPPRASASKTTDPSAPIREAAPAGTVGNSVAPAALASGQPVLLTAKPSRSSFAEQLEILKRARSALRAGDSREALVVLDRHDDALRGGGLEAEARLLRIEALAASGRSAEARDLARGFIVDYPNSPLAARARRFAQPFASAE
jgi:hypothetical protein